MEQGVTYYVLLQVCGNVNLDCVKHDISKMFLNLRKNDRLSILTFDNEVHFKLKPRSIKKLKTTQELPSLLGRIYVLPNKKALLVESLRSVVGTIRNKVEEKNVLRVYTNRLDVDMMEIEEIIKDFPKLTIDVMYIK